MRVELTHRGGDAFDVAAGDLTFRIDAPGEGQSGPSPKQTLLASLGGCAGMDVAGILTKMRQPYTRLVVTVEADQTDAHPKVFGPFHLTFEVDGEVDPKKLWRAIALSRDTYCGVMAMLSKHAPVEIRVLLNGRDTPEVRATPEG